MSLRIMTLFLALALVFLGCTPKADEPIAPPLEVPELAPAPVEPTPVAPPAEPVEVTPPPETSIQAKLMELHAKETKEASVGTILQMNEEALSHLYAVPLYVDDPTAGRRPRLSQITPEVAQLLYASINLHPVIGDHMKGKYDQPNTDIGYCFGRSTYIHLALLKMGVAKEAIRKVWLVGSMRSETFNYGFHVATTVKATDGRWLVIDNITGQVLEVKDWIDFYWQTNQHKKNLRFYVTDPSKFTTSPGKYSRTQMGLDRPIEKDWYRHYFYDLMKWFQKASLADVGLPTDLRP